MLLTLAIMGALAFDYKGNYQTTSLSTENTKLQLKPANDTSARFIVSEEQYKEYVTEFSGQFENLDMLTVKDQLFTSMAPYEVTKHQIEEGFGVPFLDNALVCLASWNNNNDVDTITEVIKQLQCTRVIYPSLKNHGRRLRPRSRSRSLVESGEGDDSTTKASSSSAKEVLHQVINTKENSTEDQSISQIKTQERGILDAVSARSDTDGGFIGVVLPDRANSSSQVEGVFGMESPSASKFWFVLNELTSLYPATTGTQEPETWGCSFENTDFVTLANSEGLTSVGDTIQCTFVTSHDLHINPGQGPSQSEVAEPEMALFDLEASGEKIGENGDLVPIDS